ncbi:MAG: CoA-binding protein [Candidatus Omnitrophota bacterium]|nr:CoA-binding protein [Candidatus Omnitrophota bacterium]RKY31658.1 MAG: CoA-binding protein [Candidatus Omnitrophota bacterium]RKY44243.1 MAG: CoA-binding protein [Candidatus Omnitrophota bacterium]
MEELIRDFLRQKSFAVVGSFRNETKYAYQILKTLKNKGYEAYPVNPRLKEVEGLPCYPTIKDIPVVCDVVNIVTPPRITERIVRECKEKGVKRVWLQPGAESQEAIKFCEDNGIKVIHSICVMMEGVKKQKEEEGGRR